MVKELYNEKDIYHPTEEFDELDESLALLTDDKYYHHQTTVNKYDTKKDSRYGYVYYNR